MSIIVNIEDLQAVAVMAQPAGAPPWKAATPVFSLLSQPDQIIWPIRVEARRVVGVPASLDALATAIEQGVVVSIDPLAARNQQWALVRTDNGVYRYVASDEAWRWRNADMKTKLLDALKAFKRNEADAAMDLFDSAYLTNPQNVVVATLRAGAACALNDSDWIATCVEDLIRVVEYVGTELSSCRANILWSELPRDVSEDLFTRARTAYEDAVSPSEWLEVPVPLETRRLAAALQLLRMRHPRDTSRFPHARLRGALNGEPDHLAAIDTILHGDTEWALAKSQSILDADPTVAAALSWAQIENFKRFARTLYTLEISADERDRRADWLSFCRRTAGVEALRETVPWRAGELSSEDMRSRLGMDGDPIQSVRRLVEEQVGAYVGAIQLPEGGGHHFASTIPPRAPPCVFSSDYEHTEAPARLRFAMAHELAHLLLDRHSVSAWVCRGPDHGRDRSDIEKRANAFAAYFLAPRRAVCEAIPTLAAPGSSDFVRQVGVVRARFGLTAVAAGEHLLNCHAFEARDPLPDDLRQRLRVALGSEPIDADDTSLDDAGDSRLDLLHRGRFVALVQKVVAAGLLDAARGASLLGVDVATYQAVDRDPNAPGVH